MVINRETLAKEFTAFFGIEKLEIEQRHKFQIGETARLKDESVGLGMGEVRITAVHEVPEKSWLDVGHTQLLEFTKDGMVFDTYRKQYVPQKDLSQIGKEHPLTISGFYLSK